MEKDFDTWNEQKKVLDTSGKVAFFRRREIHWCRMGLNVGYEQNGKGSEYQRPVLVIRKLGKYTFLGIPITTKIKSGFIYQGFYLSNGEKRIAVIGQVRTFDARRLTMYVDTLAPKEFFPIIKAIQNLIEPLSSDILPESDPGNASLELPPEANT